MSVNVKKLMESMDDGSKEQFYPEISVESIVNLSDLTSNFEIGVISVNGEKGVLTIPTLTEEEYSKLTQIIELFDEGKIQNNLDLESVDNDAN